MLNDWRKQKNYIATETQGEEFSLQITAWGVLNRMVLLEIKASAVCIRHKSMLTHHSGLQNLSARSSLRKLKTEIVDPTQNGYFKLKT